MSVTVTQVLDAIDSALGVIQTVASTPGISTLPYVNIVLSSVQALKAAETAGRNIAPYIEAIADTFTGGVPTQDQIDALDVKIKELDAVVDAPLPPKEDGEPE